MSKLKASLLELQKKPMAAKQSGTNPHFKSDYSTLKDIWDACRKQLTDNGVLVTNTLIQKDGETYLSTTLLLGEAGSEEMLTSDCPIVGATDMQKLGSAITYARRYNLAVLTGVIPEDDDGNLASAPSTPAPATDKQVGLIHDLLMSKEVPNEVGEKVTEKLEAGLTLEQAKTIITKLKEYDDLDTASEAGAPY